MSAPTPVPEPDVAILWPLVGSLIERGWYLSLTFKSGVDLDNWNHLTWEAELRGGGGNAPIRYVLGWSDDPAEAIRIAAAKTEGL